LKAVKLAEKWKTGAGRRGFSGEKGKRGTGRIDSKGERVN